MPRPLAILLAGLLLLLAATTAHAAEPLTVAVLDLSNDTGDAAFDPAGPGVAAILLTKLSRTESLRIVERSALSALSDEMDLGASGRVDPATAARAGRLVGADHVVLGSIFTVKLPSISVSVRVVDVETGEVVVAQDVVGEVGENGEEFFVLVDEVAYLVLDALEVRLGGRERIEFGQIDVRRLDTVSLYGGALQALDRGESAAAESLLGQALALEPGFVLATETLASIAADIGQRRTDVAHESVVAVHALWDRLREVVAGDPLAEGDVCRAALAARLMLVDGALADFISAEEARLAYIEAALAAAPPDQHGGMKTEFATCWRETLRSVGGDRQITTTFYDATYWPFEIKEQLADVLLRMGSGDFATALMLDAWQHRGPQSARIGKPAHPFAWAKKNGLHDLSVVLQQQTLRAAELRGDADAAKKALDALERAVESAQAAREQRAAWKEFLARAAAEPASRELLRLELRAMRAIKGDTMAQRAAYAAFCARVDGGWYVPILEPEARDFKKLAKAWLNVADANWSAKWFVERRFAHLVVYQQQVPPTEPEEEEKYREAIERFATGKYRQ